MKNRFSLLLAIFFTVSALADLKDDLYGENEAHKTYFDSFVMNCSQRTPQCVEREFASDKEESFNQIFINALDRDIQEWPNNELSKFRLALQTREDADSDFASGFFGNAAELYQDAFDQIAKLLDDADIIVAEDFDILPKGHRMYSKNQTYHLVLDLSQVTLCLEQIRPAWDDLSSVPQNYQIYQVYSF